MTLESKHMLIAATAVVLVLATAFAPVAAVDVAASQPATQPGAALPPKTVKAVKALLAKAELVVLGKVEAVHDRTAKDAGMLYDVKVEKVLKGKWRKKSLSFRSTGWVGYAKYTKGQRVLLFLRHWGDKQDELLQLRPVVYISAPQAGGLDLRPVEKYLKLIKALQAGGDNLAAERAKLLRQNVDKFSLTLKHINPHGPNIRPVVRLTVAEMGGRVRTWRISKAQAVKIIDHLAAEGFLASSRDIFVTKAPEITGPRCVLSVGGLPRVSLEENLGWNLKMLGRLDALRKVLDGKAGKAVAEFIKALEPQRKKWREVAASFVKRMKASKRALNLVLRHHPADPRQRHAYQNLHLYWAADAPAKLPAPMIGMSKREALAAIDALAKAGYFERAGDVTARRAMRTLTPWPEHKGPCYSLTVSSDNLDCHANLGWDLKMLEYLDALRKAFDKGSDAGKAMDKVLKVLDRERVVVQLPKSGPPVLVNRGPGTIWYSSSVVEVKVPHLARIRSGPTIRIPPGGGHVTPRNDMTVTIYKTQRVEAGFDHTWHWTRAKKTSQWPAQLGGRVVQVKWLPLKPGGSIAAKTPRIGGHPPGLSLVFTPWTQPKLLTTGPVFVTVRVRRDPADSDSEIDVKSNSREAKGPGLPPLRPKPTTRKAAPSTTSRPAATAPWQHVKRVRVVAAKKVRDVVKPLGRVIRPEAPIIRAGKHAPVWAPGRAWVQSQLAPWRLTCVNDKQDADATIRLDVELRRHFVEAIFREHVYVEREGRGVSRWGIRQRRLRAGGEMTVKLTFEPGQRKKSTTVTLTLPAEAASEHKLNASLARTLRQLTGAANAPTTAPAAKTAERAKLLKKGIESFRLTLRWHTTQGKSLSPGQSLQLTTVEADYDSMPCWTTVVISKQRAGKIIEHLAAEGFLERASDVKPAKSYPVPKLKSYSLTVRTTFGPHLYEHMPWGLNLLKRVERLRKVMAGNRDAAKALDKILAPLKLMPAARNARPVCIAALRKIQKDFAALAVKYPKELGHLGRPAIDEKKLLLHFPIKGLAKTTQPARRAASAGQMRSMLKRRLRPDELGLFVQFTVPMPKRPRVQWLYSNVGFSWWWMWPNRSFSSKAQQGLLNMLTKALEPLNELENAMVAADLARRKTGAFVLRGRPGVKLSLRLAPKRADDGSAIIELYATNETKKVLALCPPFPQVLGDGKPWHYRASDPLPMMIRAFDGGKDPFIYIKPGQRAKIGAAVATGLSPGRHTVRLAVCHACDTWIDQRPVAYDGPPITHKIPSAWTGVLVSGEMTIDIPTPLTTRPRPMATPSLRDKSTIPHQPGWCGTRPTYRRPLIGGRDMVARRALIRIFHHVLPPTQSS